ncbi:MAG: ATP-binding cassette domain-containing protein, partial [Rhizomicrobium sp.]
MAGPQFVYFMKDLSKTYAGGKQVLKNIYLSFYPGAKIGIVGVNGAGKSTLLRIMAGIDTEFTGEAWAADGVNVGYLPQEPQLDDATDVLGNVMEGVAAKRALVDRFNEIAANYTDETADEMAELQDKIEAAGLWDLESQVEMAMDALRCPDGDAEVSKLSGGEKRRVALCRLLLEAPDILLLDEPTNHLDAETVAWLEKTLKEYKGCIILVTHDRYFLDNVTGWILELDRGRGIPHEGNYSTFLGEQEKRLLQEGKEAEARESSLAREREWISRSPKARQAKSKARINAYEELLARSQEQRQGAAQILIPVSERLGSIVVEAEGLTKAYGERLLFENVNFKLPPGGIVGVIGPNG